MSAVGTHQYVTCSAVAYFHIKKKANSRMKQFKHASIYATLYYCISNSGITYFVQKPCGHCEVNCTLYNTSTAGVKG